MEGNKKKKTVFLIWTIVFLFLSYFLIKGFITTSLVSTGDLVLSAIGMKSFIDGSLVEKIDESFRNQHSSQTQGETIFFFSLEELGERSDGYFYSIARVGDSNDFFNNTGRYIVVKKYGSYPRVDLFALPRAPEMPYEGEYLIANILPTDDFSDLIDDSFENDHSDIFTGRTNYDFEVLDIDIDILKTPAEIKQDRDAGFGDGLMLVFLLIILFCACSLGLLLSIPLLLVTVIMFCLMATFIVLFIVFLIKTIKMIKSHPYVDY